MVVTLTDKIAAGGAEHLGHAWRNASPAEYHAQVVARDDALALLHELLKLRAAHRLSREEAAALRAEGAALTEMLCKGGCGLVKPLADFATRSRTSVGRR